MESSAGPLPRGNPKLARKRKGDKLDRSLPVFKHVGWGQPLHPDDYQDVAECNLVLLPSVGQEFTEKLWQAICDRFPKRHHKTRQHAFTFLCERISSMFYEPVFSFVVNWKVANLSLPRPVREIVRAILRDEDLFFRTSGFHSETDDAKGFCYRYRPAGIVGIPLRSQKSGFSAEKRVATLGGASFCLGVDLSDDGDVSQVSQRWKVFAPSYVQVRQSNFEWMGDNFNSACERLGYFDYSFFVIDSLRLVRTCLSDDNDFRSLGHLWSIYATDRKLAEKVKELGRPVVDGEFDYAQVRAGFLIDFNAMCNVIEGKANPKCYVKHGRAVHSFSSMSRQLRCLLSIDDGYGEFFPVVESDLSAAYFCALARDAMDLDAMTALENGTFRSAIRDRAIEKYGYEMPEDSSEWKRDLMRDCLFNHERQGMFASPLWQAFRDLFPVSANHVRRVRAGQHYGPTILSHRLTKIEGKIVRAAVMADQSIPKMPNNDGIFAASNRREEVRKSFAESARTVLGFDARIGVKVPSTDFIEWLLEHHRDQLSDRIVIPLEARLRFYRELQKEIEDDENETSAALDGYCSVAA